MQGFEPRIPRGQANAVLVDKDVTSPHSPLPFNPHVRLYTKNVVKLLKSPHSIQFVLRFDPVTDSEIHVRTPRTRTEGPAGRDRCGLGLGRNGSGSTAVSTRGKGIDQYVLAINIASVISRNCDFWSNIGISLNVMRISRNRLMTISELLRFELRWATLLCSGITPDSPNFFGISEFRFTVFILGAFHWSSGEGLKLEVET